MNTEVEKEGVDIALNKKEMISGINSETGDKDIVDLNIDEQSEAITFETLNKVSYGKDLQAKFEELGIGDCYASGKKKAFIINKGLARLAEIEKLRKEGVSEDQIFPKAIESESLKAHKAKEDFAKSIADELDAEAEAAEFFIKKKFSEAQMREKLFRTDMNIKGGNPKMKDVLVKRRRVLAAAYKKMFKVEYIQA